MASLQYIFNIDTATRKRHCRHVYVDETGQNLTWVLTRQFGLHVVVFTWAFQNRYNGFVNTRLVRKLATPQILTRSSTLSVWEVTLSRLVTPRSSLAVDSFRIRSLLWTRSRHAWFELLNLCTGQGTQLFAQLSVHSVLMGFNWWVDVVVIAKAVSLLLWL